MVTKFCTVVLNISGSSLRNLLHITFLTPRILRCSYIVGKFPNPWINYWIMSWKGCGRKWLWVDLKLSQHLLGQTKENHTTTQSGQSVTWNEMPPKHKAETPPLGPTCMVNVGLTTINSGDPLYFGHNPLMFARNMFLYVLLSLR
jgi:hypothetical protein